MKKELLKPLIISFITVNVLITVSRLWYFDTCHFTELRNKITPERNTNSFVYNLYGENPCGLMTAGSTAHFGFPEFYSLHSWGGSGLTTIRPLPLLVNIIWTGALSYGVALYWSNKRQRDLPKVGPKIPTPPPPT